MSPRMPVPAEMGSVTDPQFTVLWSDGHRSVYTWAGLRLRCPCAACVGKGDLRLLRLRPADFPQDVRALSVSRVGNYALRFIWSDGHSTGLYTYASLRHDLCECEDCRSRRTVPSSGPSSAASGSARGAPGADPGVPRPGGPSAGTSPLEGGAR
jgi:DUF971 family protein